MVSANPVDHPTFWKREGRKKSDYHHQGSEKPCAIPAGALYCTSFVKIKYPREIKKENEKKPP